MAFARHRLAAFSDASNDGLVHLVGALGRCASADVLEGKAGVASRRLRFRHFYRQFPADIAFDESGLISLALHSPGVHPQQAEIAWLNLRTVCADDKKLRLRVARGVVHAAQLEPG